jgi:hypothetical protein
MEDKVERYTYSAIANDGKGAFWTKDPNSEGSFELIQEDPASTIENDEQASSSGNRVLRRVSIRTGQGVAVDEHYFYAISNTIILKCYVRTEKDVGFFGQAIAWDRSSKEPVLWGIDRNKDVCLTVIPGITTGN